MAKLSDEVKSKHEVENIQTKHNTRGRKRKSLSDDELVPSDFMSTTQTNRTVSQHKITNHDRIISSCLDVADLYMQVSDESCRLNAVLFVSKYLSSVETVDEAICEAFKATLPKRIRDRKPMIRAQAVLASRTFQDCKMIQDGFLHHFYRDPELMVRKALLQVMDTKVFGHDFLVDSTQDTHEVMRKAAFQRLSKISPLDLSQKQLHRVLHNGLIERERQASYSFKAHTLDSWLSTLYDGLDLYKLLEPFDVINNQEYIGQFLQLIFERDLEKLQNNGTTTQFHKVVESFRDQWLSSDNNCLPDLSQIDERVVTIWLALIKFCKSNQAIIKPVKIRTVDAEAANADESLEKIIDSQQRNDEVVELYERLMPDLVNLVNFMNRYVQHSSQILKGKQNQEAPKLEFIYQQLMGFICSFEVGDELERKTVHEVFDGILKQNLLTGNFQNFICPIIKCLFHLVYSCSSKLMINYISEMIHNVRSHLEDVASSNTPNVAKKLIHSSIKAPRSKTPGTAKKVRIQSEPLDSIESGNLEFKIATIRVDLEELKDKLEECIKKKDFDQAKTINNKIEELQSEYAHLHDRRCSVASDVSHISMVIDTEPTDDAKLSSTMIANPTLDDSNSSIQAKEDLKIFKRHPNELIKCLQMYFGCFQCIKMTQIPQTMLNHLSYLSYECLQECFKDNVRVRTMMVACNGLTALIDVEFAKQLTTLTLFTAACFDQNSIEIRTVGFKSLVDVICQHDDLEVPSDKLIRFLKLSLADYGKYDPNDIQTNELDFVTTLIEGTTKLFYFRKISSPEVLAHLIIWWYHPRTPSKIKQFIGVFLPTFVNDISRKDNQWLCDLLEDTFVKSIEYLHKYILNKGYMIMTADDMISLSNFLSNLMPVSIHRTIIERVEERMEYYSKLNADLTKYFKQARVQLLAHISASDESMS